MKNFKRFKVQIIDFDGVLKPQLVPMEDWEVEPLEPKPVEVWDETKTKNFYRSFYEKYGRDFDGTNEEDKKLYAIA